MQLMFWNCTIEGYNLKSGLGTLRPETLGPETQDPGIEPLGLGTCDHEFQNPETKTLRIGLKTHRLQASWD